MARQVLPIVGAAVGAYFGGPQGAQIGFAIGSLIGNAVDPLEVAGNKVGDNPMQTASEGGARPIVYGKGCIRATCLIERGNRRVKKKRDRAGKGGGPVTINERVYWTFAVALGEDLVGGAILRIWEGERLVYDATETSQIPQETIEFAKKFRFYDGSESQLPDPALEVIHGIGNTPYYRGTAYVVFPDFDLTDYRESIPIYRWEVAKAVTFRQPTRIVAIKTISNSYFWRTSPDGLNWPGDWEAVPANRYPKVLVSNKDRHIGWVSPRDNIAYLEDAADGWQLCAGAGGGTTGGSRLGWASGDEVAIGTNSGLIYSQDGGLSFVRPNTTPVDLAFNVGPTWTSVRLFNRLIYRGPLGSMAIQEERFPEATLSLARDLHVGARDPRICGSYNSEPRVIYTGDGLNFLSEELPVFTSATTATCITSGFIGDEEWWLVGTDSGETAIMGPLGTWELGPNFGASCGGCTWNGGFFVMIGGRQEDGDTTGYIKTSMDLTSWTTRVTGAASGDGDSWGGISALDFTVESPNPELIYLSNVISNLHDRAGHLPGQYDVSELTDQLAGVVFEQSITYGEAINQLLGPYFADPSDYDKQIHYLKRGKPVVRTLTFDDLVDEPETSMRENAIEYPRKLHLFFQSPLTAYASTKATSARSSPDVKVIGEASVAIPITYNDADEPARISAKLHKVYWQDAEGEIEWHVTDEQIDLVPGDCVGLSLRGVVRRARITRIEDDPGQRKLVMRSDRQSAYTSNVTGIPLPPPTPPQPSIISPTVEAILDIPALTDSADDLHYLAAMSGATDVWSGATLQRSLDGGANYTTVGQVSLNAIMGSLQDTVTAADPAYTDTTNVVRVQLYTDDELDSLSQEQFLSEQGAFVLSWEDSGSRRWEVMQARDVADLGDGLFELSHLLRGCLDTEAVEHLPGAQFVWLDASILKVAAQTAWLGADLTHRAVSNGLSPETADADTLTYTGQSQTEWPVAYIQSPGVVADALAVTVVPRHRFGTDINPIRSINWSGYRITATDGANSETVETTNDTHTFDVTGWSTPIDVTVAQLNRLTGAGPAVTEQFS